MKSYAHLKIFFQLFWFKTPLLKNSDYLPFFQKLTTVQRFFFRDIWESNKFISDMKIILQIKSNQIKSKIKDLLNKFFKNIFETTVFPRLKHLSAVFGRHEILANFNRKSWNLGPSVFSIYYLNNAPTERTMRNMRGKTVHSRYFFGRTGRIRAVEVGPQKFWSNFFRFGRISSIVQPKNLLIWGNFAQIERNSPEIFGAKLNCADSPISGEKICKYIITV
jgi:hypothetical protein